MIITPLTKMELEVLKLLIFSNKEIAKILFLSERTVCTHRSNIFQKLHVHNKPQALIFALKNNILEIDDIAFLDDRKIEEKKRKLSDRELLEKIYEEVTKRGEQ